MCIRDSHQDHQQEGFHQRVLNFLNGGAHGQRGVQRQVCLLYTSHDKGSIGIGGHINPVDRQSGHDDVSTYLAGVERCV